MPTHGSPSYGKPILDDNQPIWANLSASDGLDMRPAWTCLIGIILAIALNKVHELLHAHAVRAGASRWPRPARPATRRTSSRGSPSGTSRRWWPRWSSPCAILLSVLIYAGASPIFVAYGVAMCGIGMLTLTGNTISMDVFGPVADNANGIGEMGYDREEMGEENYKRARQILADLDAVGNTTKAETKGIAIGSRGHRRREPVRQLHRGASRSGSEDEIGDMTDSAVPRRGRQALRRQPEVFIGMLIGGAVPFLFSSMLIRAVGRAAFLIVKECRMQFRDQEIWAGTKKPDYGRVVNICTSAAQGELIGPACWRS